MGIVTLSDTLASQLNFESNHGLGGLADYRPPVTFAAIPHTAKPGDVPMPPPVGSPLFAPTVAANRSTLGQPQLERRPIASAAQKPPKAKTYKPLSDDPDDLFLPAKRADYTKRCCGWLMSKLHPLFVPTIKPTAKAGKIPFKSKYS